MADARSALLIGLGLVLLLVAVFLPTAWYDQIPKDPDLPEPPVKGVTLVRLCFALEGIALLFLGARRQRPEPSSASCVSFPGPVSLPGSELRHPLPWVAAVTALAAVLRFYNLGSDLWLDEITTVLDYRNVSPFHILTAYTASNNHLLNTLMVKGMVAAVGAQEWAIRLPAAILGIVTVPAVYYLARLALGRREAVLAALLLAVSYHHILFSQNARGYSGLLLWSVLATAFFLRGLATNQTRYWVLYVLTALLGTATILYMFFTLAGHGVALLGACWVLHRHHRPVFPLLKKVAGVWVVVGVLSFHLYASILPQVYVYTQTVYRKEGVGYAFLSLEHLEELRRGLAAGFGGAAAAGALAAAAVLGVGLVAFARRQPLYCLTLVAPLAVLGLFMACFNLRASPRSFLGGLPVACILAVAAVAALCLLIGSASWVTGRWRRPIALAPTALVGVLVVLSLLSLPGYYRTPKQPNRESLRWLLARKQSDDVLVAVFVAEWGLRFYGPAWGLRQGDSFFSVRSLEALERIEGENPGKTIWLVTTFPRALRLEYPDLNRHIAERYLLRQTFPASIGDGDVSIWCGPTEGLVSK